MDIIQIINMINGGKKNPVLDQLILTSSMLNKLPKDKQKRIITNFVEELKQAVDNLEDGIDVEE